MKIALCEDEETSRAQMEEMLKQWGSKNQEPGIFGMEVTIPKP